MTWSLLGEVFRINKGLLTLSYGLEKSGAHALDSTILPPFDGLEFESVDFDCKRLACYLAFYLESIYSLLSLRGLLTVNVDNELLLLAISRLVLLAAPVNAVLMCYLL